MCSEVNLTCRDAEAAAFSPDFERKHETYLRTFCLHRWLDMEMITVEFLFINLISNAASPYQKTFHPRVSFLHPCKIYFYSSFITRQLEALPRIPCCLSLLLSPSTIRLLSSLCDDKLQSN